MFQPAPLQLAVVCWTSQKLHHLAPLPLVGSIGSPISLI